MYNGYFIIVSVLFNIPLPTNVSFVFTVGIMDVVLIDNITFVLI